MTMIIGIYRLIAIAFDFFFLNLYVIFKILVLGNLVVKLGYYFQFVYNVMIWQL
jgi:hypothetical protein